MRAGPVPAAVKESLEELLERIAAPTATPGGGTVSAICGALSVALSRMVGSLAVGKQGYEGVLRELGAIESRGKALQGRLLELAGEDSRSYEGVVVAMRLTKGSDAERAVRKAAMQDAYRRATEVPMETVGRCLEALELARLAAEKGNRNAITDAGVASLLAQAAMRGAALNVKVNLAAIADLEWRAHVEGELDAALTKGAQMAHAVDDLVASRL
jgi:formiminotetrahydrofolate cyclodeaminase